MPRRILDSKPTTVHKMKDLLSSLGEENLDQFQRRSLNYALKFAKIDSEFAEKLMKELTEKYELDEEEAVQIVNCMPNSVEELRVFLSGGRKIVGSDKLEAILSVLGKKTETGKEKE